MKTLSDFNFKDQVALIRVDFNVPMNEAQQVTDTNRISAAKSTIDAVLAQGGKAVLMSHFGRPKGQVTPSMSLSLIVDAVSNVLGVPVAFSEDCVGEKAQAAVDALAPGGVLLLENLRFHAAEEAGDETFAKQLASLGDIYINDAFGTAHRAHASTTIIAQFFKGSCCFGALLAKEILAIDKVMSSGEKPVTAILGGSKVSSKITIIENILDKVDHLIIGGGMTYTFIKAQGGSVGNSICEDDKMDLALEILEKASAKGVQVHLPVDVLAADDFNKDANTQVADVFAIPEGWEGLDAGPKTLAQFAEVIAQSKTILWNGPAGYFENPNFANGSIKIAKKIIENNKSNKIYSVAGGGDTVSLLNSLNAVNDFNFVSTAGGAFLEYLEGKELPGIKALYKHV